MYLFLKYKHTNNPSRRISQGSPTGPKPNPNITSKQSPIPLLHDENQPFIFEIRFGNKPFRFEFCDTASPSSWKLLTPSVIILCYDISSRLSLIDIQRLVRPLSPSFFHPQSPFQTTASSPHVHSLPKIPTNT